MLMIADNLPLVLAAIELMDVLVCIGIGAAVALLVYAVFNTPTEQVRLSPQREAAIATGHDDRKTVFENKFLRPLLWMLLAASHRLGAPRLKEWTRSTLTASGNINYYTPEEYIALSAFTGILIGAFMQLVFVLMYGEFSLLAMFIGLLTGTLMAFFQLYGRSQNRLHKISKRVPYALDLISLAMGAGATFVEAVRTVAREEGDDPFNNELNAMLAEIDLGTTRRRALENLAARIPLESLHSIVASAIQAEELGTPLGKVLHDQASLMRLQRTVRAENAAAVASVRILVPGLLILMSVVLTLFAPAIIRFIQRGGFF